MDVAKGLVRVVVELTRFNELPEDTVVNTFHYVDAGSASPPTSVQLDAILDDVIAFYNTVPGGATIALAGFISQGISRTASIHRATCYFKSIDPDSGDFGSPVRTRQWSLGAVSAGALEPLPGECAVVASYHANLNGIPETADNPTPPPLKIRPAARRRGRLYLGPLNDLATEASVATQWEVQLSPSFRQTVVGAANALVAGAVGGSYTWSVYSPTDDDAYDVTGGHVDNALDTQRRRGNEATSRDGF